MKYILISDIHANYDALQVVHQFVERERKKQASVIWRYWFLGDVLGRGPEPIECLRWLRTEARLAQRWVPGNHDQAVLELMRGYNVPNAQLDQIKAWRIHQGILQQEENEFEREWFKKEYGAAVADDTRSWRLEEQNGMACIFVHACIANLEFSSGFERRTNYLYPWKENGCQTLLIGELQKIWQCYRDTSETVCLLYGHTHYPVFVALEGAGLEFYPLHYGEPQPLGTGCIAINPGSVGQPKDGDPRAAFAVLDLDARTVTFHRLMYDVQSTVSKLAAGGYPQSLQDILPLGNGGSELELYREIYQAPQLGKLFVVNGKE